VRISAAWTNAIGRLSLSPISPRTRSNRADQRQLKSTTLRTVNHSKSPANQRLACVVAGLSVLPLVLFESLWGRHFSSGNYPCFLRRGAALPLLSPERRPLLEQPDGLVERRRGQVHVAHRGAEVGVSGQLLKCPNRRAAHRKVRAEGVTQDVDTAGQRQPSAGLRSLHPASQRAALEVDVRALQRDDLPAAQSRLAREEHESQDACPAALRAPSTSCSNSSKS
jgi:hypothetical protein